ncbi:hypothetical protein NicSoilB8_05480 [Arthrobacter sp. NicSoilB8]|nr:hypothetical protein NicSoilB8_05480 [Arthrobacter sp. NicSoilB8]
MRNVRREWQAVSRSQFTTRAATTAPTLQTGAAAGVAAAMCPATEAALLTAAEVVAEAMCSATGAALLTEAM